MMARRSPIMSAETYTPRLLPLRLPRICVAITGTKPAEMISRAESLVRDNSFIEFRLDYLSKPGTVFPLLKRFLEYHPEVIAIATCRRATNGGKFHGSVASEVDVLIRAADLGCQLVDLELQSANQLKASDFEKIRAHAALILSHHDFRATKNLDETFDRMLRVPADFFKIVTTATRLYDNVLMMKFLEQKGERRSLIGVCMGQQGIISRILGLRAGSAFTFAAASAGEETAPGQIAARTLRETYRIEQVDAATRVYGLLGDPVGHSLSPIMMNTAFRRDSINAVYLAMQAKSIKDFMACVRDIPIQGFSVTMPYKEQIVQYLDNSDPFTEKTGACNTVIRAQNGKLYGFNTDVFGVLRPLEQRLPLANARILVIGAGGAARAAVFGLRERNAQIFITNRSSASGQKLARQARGKFVARSALRKMDFDVIINATPVGMSELPGKPAPSPLNEDEIRTKYLMEMIYAPMETKLVKMARTKGVQVISGVEMFVHQGARQFEIWTGKPAPFDEMYRVVYLVVASRLAAALAAAKKKH